jgi:hypothetical protein
MRSVLKPVAVAKKIRSSTSMIVLVSDLRKLAG